MATQNSTESVTWTPVIHFTDGRTVRLEGGMTHADAMAAAEKAAADQQSVEYTGTIRN